MHKYCKLLKKVIEKGETEEAWEIVAETMERLYKKDPTGAEAIMEKLERLAYRIPRDEAERIVRNMRPKGQYWSYSQVEDLIRSKGITGDYTNWYLVMNMVYNDFCNTAKMYGLHNDQDFYFHMAKDFIEDPDARPMKVERYFVDY